MNVSLDDLPAPPPPGKIINIPICLWPEYLERHDLEVVGVKGAIVIVQKTSKLEANREHDVP